MGQLRGEVWRLGPEGVASEIGVANQTEGTNIARPDTIQRRFGRIRHGRSHDAYLDLLTDLTHQKMGRMW